MSVEKYKIGLYTELFYAITLSYLVSFLFYSSAIIYTGDTKYHQAHFRVSRVCLGTRLLPRTCTLACRHYPLNKRHSVAKPQISFKSAQEVV